MKTSSGLFLGLGIFYMGVALYAKSSGALGVGPALLNGTPDATKAWERTRWGRALTWPRALLPNVGIK